MKKKLWIGLVVVLVIGLGCVLLKGDSFEKKVEKLKEETQSYRLTGNMEVHQGEDVKRYAITSSWLKTETSEYFKVEMTDKHLNQQQVILKNDEGVFVVTPSLNQMYKFQGEWPTNSPKPYLLQTILDVCANEATTITTNSEGYLLEGPASYSNTTTIVNQKVQLSKDLEPIYLMGYNQDNLCELNMQFSKVEYNPTLTTEDFEQPTSSVTSVVSSTLEEADLPLYPMAVFDAKLVSATVSDIDGTVEHVLEFDGSRTFTVTEKSIQPSNEFQLIEINGQLVEGLGTLAYYNGNKLTTISSQMETSVYSDDLSVVEMLQVIESMQVSVMK